jgi:predicted amidohydrolase
LKIAAVQFKSLRGDTEENTNRHIQFIEAAVHAGADLIYFPELSLTGYEPQLAKSLSVKLDSESFDVFQQKSDKHGVTIGVGMPLRSQEQVQIGMVWFKPNEPRVGYKKQLLHADEIPFFSPGEEQLLFQIGMHKMAPAICYESLLATHAENARNMGANVYLASVAKSSGGIEKAMKHYPEMAKKHEMWVVMANSIGPSDDFIGVGNSSTWDTSGNLLAKMDCESEGLLIVDLKNSCANVVSV